MDFIDDPTIEGGIAIPLGTFTDDDPDVVVETLTNIAFCGSPVLHTVGNPTFSANAVRHYPFIPYETTRIHGGFFALVVLRDRAAEKFGLNRCIGALFASADPNKHINANSTLILVWHSVRTMVDDKKYPNDRLAWA